MDLTTRVQVPNFVGNSFLIKTMARFIVTTKRMTQFNGIRIEPGMSVEVVTKNFNNPLLMNGGQPIVDAFYRIYGIDIRKAGILNQSYLDVEQVKIKTL